MENQKKEIKLSELKKLVHDGKKKEEIAAYYGLNKAQTTSLLKEAGLKIRKFHVPKFMLVKDEVETIN